MWNLILQLTDFSYQTDLFSYQAACRHAELQGHERSFCDRLTG